MYAQRQSTLQIMKVSTCGLYGPSISRCEGQVDNDYYKLTLQEPYQPLNIQRRYDDETSNQRQLDISFKTSNRRRFHAGLTLCAQRISTLQIMTVSTYGLYDSSFNRCEGQEGIDYL